MTNEEGPGRELAADELLEQLHCLRFATPALDLRLARLVAWFKRNDVLPLGYSSFSAFARAEVDLGDSWMRDLVRLAEAELPLIKTAVSMGLVPLRDAVKAPGVAEGEEEDWLIRAKWGEVWRADADRSQRKRVDLEGPELKEVFAARELVRLLLAVPVSDDVADRSLLMWWRKKLSGQCTGPA